MFSEKDKNTTQIVTYCMEKWSTGENAGDQNTKHRGFISILVAVLQVNSLKYHTSTNLVFIRLICSLNNPKVVI
jgi:hypothetical protein